MPTALKRLLVITGETVIPLSFVGIILAWGYWVNSVNSRIEVAEKRLDALDSSQEKFQDFVRQHLEDQSNTISAVKVQTSSISAKLDMLTYKNR